MKDSDKKQFAETVQALFVGSGRKPLGDMPLKMWWGAFVNDPASDVFSAMAEVFRSSTEFITPGLVRQHMPDRSGHLAPEAAWNHAPKSDDQAAWVTTEIMVALGSCQDSIARGDLIAARRSFLETYTRLLGEAKQDGKTSAWWYSEAAGVPVDIRNETKIKHAIEAQERGWITAKKSEDILRLCAKQSPAPQIKALAAQVTKRLQIVNGSGKTGHGLQKTDKDNTDYHDPVNPA